MKIFLTLCASLTSLTALEPFSFERPNGSIVCGYLTKPDGEGSFPILIFLQGSECTCMRWFHEQLDPITCACGIGLLSIEKPGNEWGKDEERNWYTYNAYNTLEQRFCDHAQLVDLLRGGLVPGWDRRIVWIGGSEGSLLVSYLAPQVAETAACILAGSLGITSYRENAIASLQHQIEKSSWGAPFWLMPHATASACVDAAAGLIRRLSQDEDPEELKEDFEGDEEELPPRQHLSLFRSPAITPFLAATSCPILFIHGTADAKCPVEAVDALVETLQMRGRSNVTYWRMEGADHGTIYGEPYFGIRKGVQWLRQTL